MNLRPLRLLFLIIVSLLLCSVTAAAQTVQTDLDSDLQQGLKSFGTTHGSDIDSIDLTTTKLSVHIPLLSYPQRGNLHLSYTIHYESPIFSWYCDPVGDPCSYVPQTTRLGDTAKAVVVYNGLPVLQQSDIYNPQHPSQYLYTSFSVLESDGESHHMGVIGVSSGTTQQLRAIDGTGYYANISAWSHPYLYDANGALYDGVNSVAKDLHGNQIHYNSSNIVDSVNRSIPAIPSPPSSSNGAPSICTQDGANSSASWNVPGYGGTVTFTFCWIGSGALAVLSDIVLPNDTAWRFTYSSYNDTQYGISGSELTKITLPTGGYIEYSYQTLIPGGCNAHPSAFRGIATRTVYDGTNSNQWTYSWGSGWPATRALTITDPLNNTSIHTSSAFTYSGNPPVCNWKETKLQQYDSHSNLLKTTTTNYTSNTLPASVLPSQTTVTWPNNQTYNKTTSYGASFSYYWYSNKNGGQIDSMTNPGYLTANPYQVVDNNYDSNALRTTTTYYQALPNNTFSSSTCATNGYCSANLLNIASSVAISGLLNSATTDNYYDENEGGVFGDLTSIKQLVSGTTYVKTEGRAYYSTGMLHIKADALGNPTTYVYDSTNLFPSTITNALNQTTTYGYDANTGALNSVTDPNGNTTNYHYDNMARIISASYPDTGSVAYDYNDSVPSVTVTQAITSSQQLSETEIVDGLGRLIHTELTSDPEDTDNVVTTYDGLGRKASVTNPYRGTGDPTYGVTQYTYDALNRPLNTIQSDNSTIAYSYSGNTATVIDEAGKKRTSQMDGLGRLTTVWEDPNGADYVTTYGYDSLGNLWSVSQQGTNRSFSYDSLSRLQTSNNPEMNTPANNNNGTITYVYDNDGTLTSKTDGRGIQIQYTSDALHRITKKHYVTDPYNDPDVLYCYDNQSACGTAGVSNGIGRRTGMADVSGKTAWSYDTMGRPLTTNQTISGIAFATQYGYNLDGSLAQLTFPSGDTIDYTYTNAERVSKATFTDFNYFFDFNYVMNATYTPSGAPTSFSGNNGSGESVSRSYNKRLQPVTMSATTNGVTVLNLTYNFNLGAGDNGNVMGITNNLDSTRSQTFTYDGVNRLLTAGTASTWGDSYSYDGRGNLTAKTPTRGTAENWSDSVDSNNHLGGADGYDGAGNLTSLNNTVYNVFNAENQWTQQTTYLINYLYDGDGQRVERSGGSGGTRIYVYDTAGKVIEETDQSGNMLNEYLYLGGERVALLDSYASAYFYYNDYLGTPRVMTNGLNVCYDADFFPWGAEQHVYTNTCAQNYKFTGKERDPDMGVDYFGARFYQGAMARFYSPDWSSKPEPVPYSKLDNPQSLNLYTYSLNNPISMRDPDGHDGGVAAQQNKNPAVAQSATQQYNPAKTGPEDPTNPGKPLSQNPVVEKGMDEAFVKTNDGKARSGLAEAGGSIEYKDGNISISNEVDSVNSDKKANGLDIRTDANTIAVFHIHGNQADPKPSPGDRNPKAQLPDFVRSQHSLYVTVPHSATGDSPLNGYIQLR